MIKLKWSQLLKGFQKSHCTTFFSPKLEDGLTSNCERLCFHKMCIIQELQGEKNKYTPNTNTITNCRPRQCSAIFYLSNWWGFFSSSVGMICFFMCYVEFINHWIKDISMAQQFPEKIFMNILGALCWSIMPTASILQGKRNLLETNNQHGKQTQLRIFS